MKGNNLYLYDEQKYIIKKIFSLEKDEDNKNENTNLFNKEKENKYQNCFFERNIDDEKYTNIYKEIKKFLDNNKDIKINEEEIKKIIEN
jgi:CRISPR/Cas system-associated endoribonuclease Cas2